MEVLKNAVAVLAGIIGLLTAILTLYAKYLDIKKSAAQEKVDAGEAVTATAATPVRPEPAAFERAARPDEPPARPAPLPPSPSRDFDAVERSRQAVRSPAITMMVAGGVSLFFNLFVAGFGYVDQFVTPLTDDTRNKQAYMEAVKRGEASVPPWMRGTAAGDSDGATVVLTVFTLLSLSVASAAAVWAGYGMLRLRSYWLSVAGSFAIMGGAGFCCMAGIPIGIWSLSVLYKPEVVSSFR